MNRSKEHKAKKKREAEWRVLAKKQRECPHSKETKHGTIDAINPSGECQECGKIIHR